MLSIFMESCWYQNCQCFFLLIKKRSGQKKTFHFCVKSLYIQFYTVWPNLGRETAVSRRGDISGLGPPSVIYGFSLSLDFSRMIPTWRLWGKTETLAHQRSMLCAVYSGSLCFSADAAASTQLVQRWRFSWLNVLNLMPTRKPAI